MKLFDAPVTPELREELKDKPYNLCLRCKRMSSTCDGPNVLAMKYSRLVEWCNALARKKKLSRPDIAEGSNMALGTVVNFLSERTDDVMFSTLQPIVQFLVGGCWGQYPCHQAQRYMEGLELPEDRVEILETELEDAIKRLEDTQAELETAKRNSAHMNEIIANMQASHAAELAAVREDGQKKVDYLKETAAKLEKSNGRFMFVIVALAVVIIGALVVDYFNREIGFFWLSR